MEHDARGDAGAAVGDDLAVRQLAERLVPRRIQRTGDAPGDTVDRVRLAAPARRDCARRRRPGPSRAAASSARSIVSPDRARGLNSPVRSLPRRRAVARATRQDRRPRTRRDRSAGAATRAARPHRAIRTRRRAHRARSRRGRRQRRSARPSGADGARRARPARPGRARRRGTLHPGCGLRDRPVGRSPGRRATSGSRRRRSSSVTGNHAAA